MSSKPETAIWIFIATVVWRAPSRLGFNVVLATSRSLPRWARQASALPRVSPITPEGLGGLGKTLPGGIRLGLGCVWPGIGSCCVTFEG